MKRAVALLVVGDQGTFYTPCWRKEDGLTNLSDVPYMYVLPSCEHMTFALGTQTGAGV